MDTVSARGARASGEARERRENRESLEGGSLVRFLGVCILSTHIHGAGMAPATHSLGGQWRPWPQASSARAAARHDRHDTPTGLG